MLAPGFYAAQDVRTPVKIAVVVLLITQCLNIVLVPFWAHAGLALSTDMGALNNALWLLAGLISRQLPAAARLAALWLAGEPGHGGAGAVPGRTGPGL